MKTLLPVAICLGVLVGAAAQAQNSVQRIFDRGRDGDITFYQVMCSNGTLVSVTVTDQPPQACAQAVSRDEVCSANWTLNEAAEAACK